MKKKLIEINYDKISNDDVIIFKHEKWIVMPKSVYLNDIYKNHDDLVEHTENEVKRLEDIITDLQSQINKLKQDVLYILGEDTDTEEEPENEENEQDA